MSWLGRLWRNRSAASAAEFALVLPAALLIMFGVVDVGRYAWQMNQYEKAVQLGARYAVATNVVPGALAGDSAFTGQTCGGVALEFGDTICADAMNPITCTAAVASGSYNASCVCDTSANSGACLSGSVNNTAFINIVNRMRVASARIYPTDVTIEYKGSGLGYYGDPASYQDSGGNTVSLQDAAPIVTVRLTSMRYQPITLTLVGVDVPYPEFSYSLTLEDGVGTVAS